MEVSCLSSPRVGTAVSEVMFAGKSRTLEFVLTHRVTEPTEPVPFLPPSLVSALTASSCCAALARWFAATTAALGLHFLWPIEAMQGSRNGTRAAGERGRSSLDGSSSAAAFSGRRLACGMALGRTLERELQTCTLS